MAEIKFYRQHFEMHVLEMNFFSIDSTFSEMYF